MPHLEKVVSDFDYCELCWRRTMASRTIQLEMDKVKKQEYASQIVQGRKEICNRLGIAESILPNRFPAIPEWSSVPNEIPSDSQPSGGKSLRFCRIHNPSNPKSKYRVDLPYRDRFQAMLKKLYVQKPHNEKLHGMHEDQIRQVAYDLVHPRPRKGWRNIAVEMVKQKYSVTEVARYFGVSRQAIYLAIKSA